MFFFNDNFIVRQFGRLEAQLVQVEIHFYTANFNDGHIEIGSVLCQNIRAIGQLVFILWKIKVLVHHFCEISCDQVIQVYLNRLCTYTNVMHVHLHHFCTTANPFATEL